MVLKLHLYLYTTFCSILLLLFYIKITPKLPEVHIVDYMLGNLAQVPLT